MMIASSMHLAHAAERVVDVWYAHGGDVDIAAGV
jgi:hypothetical protein